MNFGIILFGIACVWIGVLFSALLFALFFAHGERERDGTDVPVEHEDAVRTDGGFAKGRLE